MIWNAKKFVVLGSICAMIIGTTACGGRIQIGGNGSKGDKASKYTAGDAVVSDEITDIDIDWASGSIDIITSADNTITIHEESTKELEDSEKVQWSVDESCLRIQFCESHTNIEDGKDKYLTITVPEKINLNSLTIDGASAVITQAPIHTKTLSVDTATGNYTGKVTGLCKKVELDSASGNLDCSFEQLGTFEASSATGQINCSFDSADSVEVNTASGDVSLHVADDFGFTLAIDTASGKVVSELPMTIQNKKYVHGDGSCKMSIDTATGDIFINGK